MPVKRYVDQLCAQVELDELNGDELVVNGTFTGGSAPWTFGGAWSYDAINEQMDSDGSGVGAQSVTQAGVLPTNPAYYIVTFDIVNYVSGDLIFRSGSPSYPLDGSTILRQADLNDGTYSLVFFPTSAGTSISFTSHNAGPAGTLPFIGSIDNVSVKQLCEVDISILNEDNSEVFFSSDNTYVTYLQSFCHPTGHGMAQICLSGDIDVDGEVDTVWDDLADGCYRVYLYDANGEKDQLLLNPGFDTAKYWSINNLGPGGWSIGGSAVNHVGTGGGAINSFYQDFNFDPVRCYNIEVSFTTAVAPVDGVNIYVLDSGNKKTFIGNITTTGVHTFAIDFISGHRLIFEAKDNAPEDFSLAQVNLTYGTICNGLVSDCLVLANNFDCDIKLTYTNDDDFLLPNGQYLNYTNFTYTQTLRLKKSKLWHSKYDETAVDEVDSDGERNRPYYDSVKVQRLGLYEIPESVHDAFAIAWGHSDTFINGIRYTRFDTGYDPQWRNSSDNSEIEIDVVADFERNTNNNCGTDACGVSNLPEGSLSELSGGTSFVIKDCNGINRTPQGFANEICATLAGLGGDGIIPVIDLVDGADVPPTEASGNRYIIQDYGDGAVNAAWDGAAYNDYVEFNGTVWVAAAPTIGNLVFITAKNRWWHFVTAGWRMQNGIFTRKNGTLVTAPADALENNLYNENINEGTLNADSVVEIECWGTINTLVGTARVRVYFGGTTLIDTGGVTSDGTWRVICRVIFNSATAQSALGQFNLGLLINMNTITTPAENINTTFAIRVTGEKSLGGETITANGLIIKQI